MLYQKYRPDGVMPGSNRHRERLDGRDLKRVSEFIGAEVGIQLPESKHMLVEGRLRKRMNSLGFSNYREYLDHALDCSGKNKERFYLIDAITTNKTDFFREPEHYDYLVGKALPVLEQNRISSDRKELCIWSAGCSTGEEPYTLSMVMHESAEKMPGLRFKILATDISRSCLAIASRGVYKENHITPISMDLRKKYLLRSRNREDGLVCMGQEIRNNVRFEVLNLIDRNQAVRQKMDIIFCRNVMIYFNKPTREELVSRFSHQLVDGGYLFVGHSESLNGIVTGLRQVAPMVYQKQ